MIAVQRSTQETGMLRTCSRRHRRSREARVCIRMALSAAMSTPPASSDAKIASSASVKPIGSPRSSSSGLAAACGAKMGHQAHAWTLI